MRLDLFNQTYTSGSCALDIVHSPTGTGVASPTGTGVASPYGISFGVASAGMPKFYVKNYNAGVEIDASNGSGMILRGDNGGGITSHIGSSVGFQIFSDGLLCGGLFVNMDVGSPIQLISGNGLGGGFIGLQCDSQIDIYAGNNPLSSASLIMQNRTTTGGVVLLATYDYSLQLQLDMFGQNRTTLQNINSNGDVYITANRDIVMSAGDIILRNNSAFASNITVTAGGVIQLSPYNSYNEITGGVKYSCATVSTTPTTVPGYGYIVLFDTDTTGADITANLIPVTGQNGRVFKFRNIGATYNVIVDPDGAETINGNPTLSITPGTAVEIVCDGSAWYTI